MKYPRFASLLFVGSAVVIACFATVACSHPSSENAARPELAAFAPLESTTRVELGGSHAPLPGTGAIESNGFVDSVTYTASDDSIVIRGWAPFDMRDTSSKIFIRDPFDQIGAQTSGTYRGMSRPDVVAEYPTRPELISAGFEAVLTHPAKAVTSAFLDSLQVYAADGHGQYVCPIRTGQNGRKGWDRKADCFQIALTYATPVFARTVKKSGHIDIFEQNTTAHTLRLGGWGSFDGRDPGSILLVKLPAAIAPSAVTGFNWLPRPDVRQKVDPSREELDRSGFLITLSLGAADVDLAVPDALALWTISADGTATPVSTKGMQAAK